MDVSLGRRAAPARTLPVLRLVEASALVLHEDADRSRVQRLSEALRRDGVLRNPPIVSALGAGMDGRFVVLDGANRVTALRELGSSHIAAQVIDYGAAEIVVSTWMHYVAEDDPALRERLAADPATSAVPVSGIDDAMRLLRRGSGVAALLDPRGVLVVGTELDPRAHARGLRELMALYGERRRFYRVTGGDLEALSATYGAGTLVAFRPFGKEDIARLAAQGERLPAGITRHVIPGRVLHLNVPLAWLQGSGAAATKQTRFDEFVEDRWRSHGVRYYPEAIYLFDE